MSCYRVANGLDHEVDDNGGDGPARGGEPAPLVDWRSMTLVSGGAHAVGRADDTKPSVAAVSAPIERGQRKVKLTSEESL